MSVAVSDMSPSLRTWNTLIQQMKSSLRIEAISIQIFVLPTIKQEGKKVLAAEMMEKAVAMTSSTIVSESVNMRIWLLLCIMDTFTAFCQLLRLGQDEGRPTYLLFTRTLLSAADTGVV